MGNDPGDLLALNFRLEVVALDGDKHLAQGLGGDHIVQEFNRQSAAKIRLLAGNQVQRGKGTEQEEQSQAVVQVLQCVYEGGVALLDDVIELDFGKEGQASLQVAEILDGTIAVTFLGKNLQERGIDSGY